MSQGGPATSGIPGPHSQPAASPLPCQLCSLLPRCTTCQPGFFPFLSPDNCSTLQKAKPLFCLVVASPSAAHPLLQSHAPPPTLTQDQAGGPCLALNRDLPRGCFQAADSRDSLVEASAAISCLLGHHPQHCAPPPGPSLPLAPHPGSPQQGLHTDRRCWPGPPPPDVASRFPTADLGRPDRSPCCPLRERQCKPLSGLNGGQLPGLGGP